MTANELRVGKHFRVVGVPLWWEVVKLESLAVLVRLLEPETRTFETAGHNEVTISFRPRAFYISRETLVEVEG